MTSEWLDVARYSGTYGYRVDRGRNVWPWRDYRWSNHSGEINPANQFVTEQIAGDISQCYPGSNTCTCFNRLHQKVKVAYPKNFGSICSRPCFTFVCSLGQHGMHSLHDHKYDPLPREIIFLFQHFNNIDEAGLYSYFTGSVPTPTLGAGRSSEW